MANTWVNVIDLFYPVGIIIEFASTSTTPGSIFGGSWNRLTNEGVSPARWQRIA